MINKQRGITLVELLVALVIGALIIAATFSSYQLVAKQYERNSEIQKIHHASRVIMMMIERDIQMAGYTHKCFDGEKTIEPFRVASQLKYDDLHGIIVNQSNKVYTSQLSIIDPSTIEVYYDQVIENCVNIIKRKVKYYIDPDDKNKLMRETTIIAKYQNGSRSFAELPSSSQLINNLNLLHFEKDEADSKIINVLLGLESREKNEISKNVLKESDKYLIEYFGDNLPKRNQTNAKWSNLNLKSIKTKNLKS